MCRLGHTCVRRLRKSCGPECGWPCWLTPPCAAVSWRRRQALLPPSRPPVSCTSAPRCADAGDPNPMPVDTIYMYRTSWEANASFYWAQSLPASSPLFPDMASCCAGSGGGAEHGCRQPAQHAQRVLHKRRRWQHALTGLLPPPAAQPPSARPG